NSNFGFSAEPAPTVSPETVTTYQNFPLSIDLAPLAQGPAVSPLSFIVSAATHGAVRLLADGHTALFTPASRLTAAASFQVQAVDANLTSQPATVAVTVSTAALTNVRLDQQDPVLQVGQSTTIGVLGDFSDHRTIALLPSLVQFQVLDPSIALVTPA